VDPAPFFLRRGEHLAQRRPKTKCAVANGQFGGLLQAAALQIEQHLQRLGKIACRHALEREPRQQFLDRFRLAQMPRQDAGRERVLVIAEAAIAHARHLHGHRSNTGHDLAFRQEIVPHQACPPIFEPFPGKGVHEQSQFRLDRLFDQLARSIAEHVREWVGANSRWIGHLGDGDL